MGNPLSAPEGQRKYRLGLLYLVGSFGLAITAVYKGVAGWDAVALASIPTSVATGLGVVVWGNSKEHAAKNGHGNGGTA